MHCRSAPGRPPRNARARGSAAISAGAEGRGRPCGGGPSSSTSSSTAAATAPAASCSPPASSFGSSTVPPALSFFSMTEQKPPPQSGAAGPTTTSRAAATGPKGGGTVWEPTPTTCPPIGPKSPSDGGDGGGSGGTITSAQKPTLSRARSSVRSVPPPPSPLPPASASGYVADRNCARSPSSPPSPRGSPRPTPSATPRCDHGRGSMSRAGKGRGMWGPRRARPRVVGGQHAHVGPLLFRAAATSHGVLPAHSSSSTGTSSMVPSASASKMSMEATTAHRSS
mmetsp:Transcript_2009/g.4365  ORF Transcript_2009/g.4365 Transcript_2009/m.4365 type:complete len:282 (+) Transcript_2009:1245-2090(+)